MKQMSNSLHLKHFVSSPKICADRPGAWPRWGCPTDPSPASTGGLGTVRQEESWVHSPPSKADRRGSGEAETKGGWNSQFVNLMDPLRLLAAIRVEKDGERSGKKKKKDSAFLLNIIIPGPAWAGDHWGRTKSQRRRQCAQTEGPACWMNQKLLTF